MLDILSPCIYYYYKTNIYNCNFEFSVTFQFDFKDHYIQFNLTNKKIKIYKK